MASFAAGKLEKAVLAAIDSIPSSNRKRELNAREMSNYEKVSSSDIFLVNFDSQEQLAR
jgi:hypothetical protein